MKQTKQNDTYASSGLRSQTSVVDSTSTHRGLSEASSWGPGAGRRELGADHGLILSILCFWFYRLVRRRDQSKCFLSAIFAHPPSLLHALKPSTRAPSEEATDLSTFATVSFSFITCSINTGRECGVGYAPCAGHNEEVSIWIMAVYTGLPAPSSIISFITASQPSNRKYRHQPTFPGSCLPVLFIRPSCFLMGSSYR
jgi:hypothetical protein